MLQPVNHRVGWTLDKSLEIQVTLNSSKEEIYRWVF
jgi:hypothetical protein